MSQFTRTAINNQIIRQTQKTSLKSLGIEEQKDEQIRRLKEGNKRKIEHIKTWMALSILFFFTSLVLLLWNIELRDSIIIHQYTEHDEHIESVVYYEE